MTVRESLAELLAESGDQFLSGEEAAEKLGVTRAAVWKAVRALEDAGARIEAVPNRGYRLAPDCDLLRASGIVRELDDPRFDVRCFDTLPSTNTYLRELAAEGAPEGVVAVAAAQTAGKGRMGRSFFSPADTGLYMSVLLRPSLAAEDAPRITTAAAVAVCEALEEVCEVMPGIKWVNDIFLDNRKVCGILTEAAFDAETGTLSHAVTGIGINVYEPDGGFPEDLRDIAGAVTRERRRGLRAALCAAVLRHFWALYSALPGGSCAAEYRKRCLCIGRRVILLDGADTPALALDVDDACRLRVRLDDGTEKLLSSGEIRIRLPAAAERPQAISRTTIEQ